MKFASDIIAGLSKLAFKQANVKLKRKLQVECGTTQISLENAMFLMEQYGIPHTVTLINGGNETDADYGVLAIWDGVMHLFTGFSWGYSGEGPRGLDIFLKACGSFYSTQAANIKVSSYSQREIVSRKQVSS